MPLCIKKTSHPNGIIPFSSIKEAVTKKTLTQSQPPSALNSPKLSTRKLNNPSSPKLDTKLQWSFSKKFFQSKKNIEAEMLNLFSFLANVNIADKLNLINKFNIKIISGEISTVEQMVTFLNKARELSDCIKLYLLKNEYSENFMREISFDVFENGFNPQTQEEIRNYYSNYFASNS